MGLSSSQARLLNLTRRMHDIEYKAQNLEAQKLQMANESKQVYQEYENALNKQKVQFKTIAADGSAQYEDASIETLLTNNYKIKIYNGGKWYEYTGDETAAKWKPNNFKSFSTTVTKLNITAPNDYKAGSIENINNAGTTVTGKFASDVKSGDNPIYVYLENGVNEERNDIADIPMTSKEALRNLVEAGFIVFEKPMSDGTYSEVNIATDTNLQEVTDDTELKKAEAKYEADMRKINQKDKKFDTDLAAMDNERTAIKSEMETLKTIAKDNVDRTFKLFS